MSKSDQLIEYIARDVIEFLVTDRKTSIKEAMSQFYGSLIFEKLADTETGLYLCGSAYIYDLFRDELEYGKIVQREV